MSIQTQLDDTPILDTRIPESRKVEGLEYGANVSMTGWAGYYVRPEGSGEWGVVRLTPASDELVGDGTDAEIVAAIREELDA